MQKNKNSSFVVESKHTKRIKRQNLALNEESPLKGMSQTLDFTLLDSSLHKPHKWNNKLSNGKDMGGID